MKQHRVAQVAMILALVLALLAPVAVAAKGGGGKGKPGWGGGSGSSLGLVLLNSTDGLPHYGQQVTFEVSTTVTDRPFVQLSCYQNGVLVYSFQAGFYEGYPWSKVYTLSSNAWTGGAAECSAELVYTTDGKRLKTLVTLNFHVYA
jgi:hypothetical protein